MTSVLAPLLNQFAKKFDYDVQYMHEMEAVAPGTLWRYLFMTPLSQHRTTVPVEYYYTAKLVATVHHDCGPCVRLVINMASAEGVDESTLWMVLKGECDKLTENTRLVVDYSRAVLANDSLVAADLREQIVERWGEGAVADLSLAIAFGGFYPTLKRGLGHAQSCEPFFGAALKRA